MTVVETLLLAIFNVYIKNLTYTLNFGCAGLLLASSPLLATPMVSQSRGRIVLASPPPPNPGYRAAWLQAKMQWCGR